MATFVNDTMTGTAGTTLPAHTGETGATWTLHANGSAGAVLSDANRLRGSTGSVSNLYYASGTPATAEYDVEADLFVVSLIAADIVGVAGMIATGANTYYTARYSVTGTVWQLVKVVAGTTTVIGTAFSQALTPGQTYRVKLQLRTGSQKLFVDGVERISDSADTAIVAAGLAGIRIFTNGTGNSNTTGIHLDNFSASDPVVAAGGGAKNLLMTGVG